MDTTNSTRPDAVYSVLLQSTPHDNTDQSCLDGRTDDCAGDDWNDEPHRRVAWSSGRGVFDLGGASAPLLGVTFLIARCSLVLGKDGAELTGHHG